MSSQVHLGVGDAMHSRLDDNVPGRESACKESNEVDNPAHIMSGITLSSLKLVSKAQKASTAVMSMLLGQALT